MSRKIFISSDMSVDERMIEVAEESPESALLWPWLLTALDDWGRSTADPKRLKYSVFASIACVTSETIATALHILADKGLIQLYTVAGKSYMAVSPDTWFKYQTHIRSEKRDSDKSRYPAPPGAQLREDARNVAQVRAVVSNSQPSPSPSLSPSLSPSHSEDLSSSLHTPDDGERSVVSDASASSRDDFFSEDEDVDLSAYLDTLEPEPDATPEDSAPLAPPPPAHPANVTTLPTARTQAVATSTALAKRTSKARTTFDEDSPAMRLACYLKVKLQAVNPDVRVPPNLSAWAGEFDKMIRLDEREYDGIKRVIDFATTDSFWQTNILSANAVRRQYARLAQIIRNKQQQGENYHNGHTGHYAATGTEGQSSGRASADGGGQTALSTAQGTRGRAASGIHQPDSTRHGIYAHLVE